jgi:hypothetical protein
MATTVEYKVAKELSVPMRSIRVMMSFAHAPNDRLLMLCQLPTM